MTLPRLAVLGGLVGLLGCTSAGEVSEEEWNAALAAARADRQAADPDGKYFGVFVKRLIEIQSPALKACQARYPASASSNFQAVARLSRDGRVQKLLMKPPLSEFLRCLRERIEVAALPVPPKEPYWIFWGSLKPSP